MNVLLVLLRDLGRQRWRTALTVLGIAIGIFALVVFGAMAEHFRSLVAQSKGYVQGTIRIVTKTNKEGVNPGITEEDVEAARSIPGVRACVPTLTLLFDGYNLEDNPLIFLSPKPLVEGVPPEYAELMRPSVKLVAGRWLRKGDTRAVMVARWLVERRETFKIEDPKLGDRIEHYALGAKVELRHVATEIVGIFEAPATVVVPAGITPLDTLKLSVQASNVAAAKKFFESVAGDKGFLGIKGDKIGEIAEKFVQEQEERYYLHEIVCDDPSPAAVREVARRTREKLPHLAVIDPETLGEEMEKAFGMFLAITLVVSLVSSLVGGLLIVNTMAMAVVERRREIAIKVAVGASTAQILSEFLAEASAMGFVGAVAGTVAGRIAIAILDPWLLSKFEVGDSVFLVTPSLVATALGFGMILGALAGIVPAFRAARTDPAPGLREL